MPTSSIINSGGYLLWQFGVRIIVITSFKDTHYIEILPNAKKSKRGKFPIYLCCNPVLSLFLFYFLVWCFDTFLLNFLLVASVIPFRTVVLLSQMMFFFALVFLSYELGDYLSIFFTRALVAYATFVCVSKGVFFFFCGYFLICCKLDLEN